MGINDFQVEKLIVDIGRIAQAMELQISMYTKITGEKDPYGQPEPEEEIIHADGPDEEGEGTTDVGDQGVSQGDIVPDGAEESNEPAGSDEANNPERDPA